MLSVLIIFVDKFLLPKVHILSTTLETSHIKVRFGCGIIPDKSWQTWNVPYGNSLNFLMMSWYSWSVPINGSTL